MAIEHIMGDSSYLAQKMYASEDLSQVGIGVIGSDGYCGLYKAHA